LISRALTPTNLIRTGVATLVIAKWERALDERRLQQGLAGKSAEQRSRKRPCSDVRLTAASRIFTAFLTNYSAMRVAAFDSRGPRRFRQQIPKRVLRRVAAAPLHELFLATSFSARLFYETVMG
jgi:hypothetical protein